MRLHRHNLPERQRIKQKQFSEPNPVPGTKLHQAGTQPKLGTAGEAPVPGLLGTQTSTWLERPRCGQWQHCGCRIQLTSQAGSGHRAHSNMGLEGLGLRGSLNSQTLVMKGRFQHFRLIRIFLHLSFYQ